MLFGQMHNGAVFMPKGQDILVAAAAGSGKTAVLVERIIQRILRDEIDVGPFTSSDIY